MKEFSPVCQLKRLNSLWIFITKDLEFISAKFHERNVNKMSELLPIKTSNVPKISYCHIQADNCYKIINCDKLVKSQIYFELQFP